MAAQPFTFLVQANLLEIISLLEPGLRKAAGREEWLCSKTAPPKVYEAENGVIGSIAYSWIGENSSS